MGSWPVEVAEVTARGSTVWASLDRRANWRLERRVFDGPSDCSSPAAGRLGTLSEGMVYLLIKAAEAVARRFIQAARRHR